MPFEKAVGAVLLPLFQGHLCVCKPLALMRSRTKDYACNKKGGSENVCEITANEDGHIPW